MLFERHADSPEAAPQDPAPAVVPPAASTRRHASTAGLQRHPSSDGTQPAGQDTETAEPAKAPEQALEPAIPSGADDSLVTAAERSSPQLLESVLDVHLDLRTGATVAHAKLQVRNGGDAPLSQLVLQLSSSLQWQSVRLVSGTTSVPVPLQQHRLTTDADHTGAAMEAILTLPAPLAPGGTVALDTFYGGTLGSSAERLNRLGAPANRAALADWDTVSDSFVGLRGFGNVLWTPTAAPAIFLSSPADFVGAVDDQRSRQFNARVSLRLTVETDGPPLRSAFFLGVAQPIEEVSASPSVSSSSSSSDAPEADPDDAQPTHLYTASWPATAYGGQAASLFLTASGNGNDTAGPLRVFGNQTDVTEAYDAAAERVRPLLDEWLGPHAAGPLQVVDLPLSGAQPYAGGSLLVAPLRAEDPKALAPSLTYPMASAWLPAGLAPWLAQGLPEFIRLLYLERTEGREAALVDLAASADALARTEALPGPGTPPLTACADAGCARTKSAYVFSMLRQIVGDDALKQALSGWLTARAQQPGTTPDEFDSRTLQRLLEAASGKKLEWFFADWVNRDAGLPDLVIVNIAPRQVERGTVNNIVPSQHHPAGGPIGDLPLPKPGDPTGPEQGTTASRNVLGPRDGSWLVAVEVQNDGGAVAEVPVSVRSGSLQNSLPLRIAAHSRATIRVPFEVAPDEVWVNDGTTPEQRSSTHHRSVSVPDGPR